MPWPDRTEYFQVIQNPAFCFRDSELKAGRVDCLPNGLPRQFAGGFASVYKIATSNRQWAIKCFLNDFPDQQQRYEAISNHLACTKLPYTVGFQFQPQGIKVSGKWYPILKMEWVQGEKLIPYLQRNLYDSDALLDLEKKWLRMVRELQSSQIAHGDFQHENILLVNGDLRLIDYDGMYVPSLAGRGSHERGHKNYQHPSRSESDFGPSLDNFSAWVIYLSIRALRVDPFLWQRVSAGDDCLVFRKEDFDSPHYSEVLRVLENEFITDHQSLSETFRSLASAQNLNKLMPVFQLLTEASLAVQSATPVGADWILDHKPKQSGERESQPATKTDDWISTHKPIPVHVFGGSFLKERGLLAALLAIALLSVFSAGGAATLLHIAAAFAIGGCYLLYRFRSCPEVATKRQHMKKAKEATNQIATLRRNLVEFDDAIKKSGEQEFRDFESVRSKHKASSDQERRDIETVEQALNQELAQLNSRQQQISQAENDEISKAFQASQQVFLDSQLRMHSLYGASIDGLGEKLKARLRINGINTAADVSYRMRHVDGIGYVKRQALQDWRQRLEIQIRSRMPSTLPSNQEAAIRSQYSQRRNAIEAEKNVARRSAQQKREGITSKYRQEKLRLDNQSQEVRRASAQKRTELSQSKREKSDLLRQWEKYQFEAKRAVDAYGNISFSAYLKNVLFLNN